MDIELSSPLSYIVYIMLTATSVAITFYIKDSLRRYVDFKEFKKQIENKAGVKASVLYSVNNKLEIFEIQEIGENNGLVLTNKFYTIYVPIIKLLNSEIIIPDKNYTELKKQEQLAETAENADIVAKKMKAMMPKIPEKTTPEDYAKALKEAFSSITNPKQDELIEIEGGK